MGLWHQIGRLQFDFLVAAGLRPEHRMLDVGCGPLRGGQHFISYLDAGHYWGIDRDPKVLEAGLAHGVAEALAAEKKPTLVEMADFGFERLGQTFDYALAQSVFTHLPLNSIMRCLVGMARVLAPDGRFYATFFDNPGGKRNIEPVHHEPGGITTFYDADPFHYDVQTLADACVGTGLKMEHLGEWDHPRDQRMLAFTRV
jgi:SAM-dependent methyltransferase